MAEEVRKLVSDPEYRDRLRQAGLENVRSRFQTSRMMDEYVALYRELACQS
jgi:glycosyltransferase involved in cell wall biosynthesis